MEVKAEKDELTIEQSFDKLSEILNKMEDGETGLEDTFKLYEEGLGLVKNIKGGIDKVEKRIKVLREEEE